MFWDAVLHSFLALPRGIFHIIARKLPPRASYLLTGTSLGAAAEWMLNFHRIFEEYADRVYNHALRMVGNPQDAEEAAQDVFINIYNGLAAFRGESRLSTWIYRITANVCLSRIRQKQLPTDSLDAEPARIRNIGAASDVEQSMEDRELCDRLLKLVGRLPERYRQIVTPHYFQELSYEELAQVTDLPVGTIGSHLYRAKAMLRDHFLKEGVSYGLPHG